VAALAAANGLAATAGGFAYCVFDFGEGTFRLSIFTDCTPLWSSFLEIDAPEIEFGGDKLNSQIPPVVALDALPDNYSVSGAARGEIRDAQMLLHVNFLWAHEQAAVTIDDAREAGFKMQRASAAIPFNRHRDARVHAWTASFSSCPYISWQAFR
jgi:hypothetical protein